MAKKSSDITLSFLPEEIVGADITKSGDYKYASVGIKVSDNERVRISYEWSGEGIPDFVMSLMSWMKASEENVDERKKELECEYKELKERL